MSNAYKIIHYFISGASSREIKEKVWKWLIDSHGQPEKEVNCILPCNLVFIYDITLYITAQVTDDTAFVHGLDLVEVDDCVLGEHRSIFLRFDNDFFYIIGEAVEAIIRGGRCNDHSVCKIIENNGWMRKGHPGCQGAH